ncbi:MAG: lactoylglutathione lyase [Candidatus Schekmanbacteria bacterium]|nr:MAG: lactoylglutathione lyase [Candidatus Schekmanbacteria bacterium]
MRFVHTMIRVRDIERSLEFYCGFIGLHEVKRKTIGDEATLVFLSDDEEKHFIELTYNHDGRDYELGDQFGHLAFSVSNLDEVEEKIKKLGWEYWPARPEVGSKYLFVCDPDGYDIEIIEEKQKKEE